MNMNFMNVTSLNKSVEESRDRLVALSETNYDSYISEAAAKILSTADSKPMVLLSGPSGSGKTTTALRLAKKLETMGRKVHTISMDDYFLPITAFNEKDMPVDENGNIDLESPYRLDIPLFSEHLKALGEGKEVEMPTFDFTTQSRPKTIPLKREKGEIIIIEGIHALNPEVTGESDDFTSRVYVSVRTRLKAADGDLLHPRLIRLMRRLCRDRLFRGREIPDIFRMFDSVSRGEELYIMPYKKRASIEIDTFLPYEVPVYSGLIAQSLAESADIMSEDANYPALIKFIGDIHALDPDVIPDSSMIREFIGERKK